MGLRSVGGGDLAVGRRWTDQGRARPSGTAMKTGTVWMARAGGKLFLVMGSMDAIAQSVEEERARGGVKEEGGREKYRTRRTSAMPGLCTADIHL